jgi:hypothetical protein
MAITGAIDNDVHSTITEPVDRVEASGLSRRKFLGGVGGVAAAAMTAGAVALEPALGKGSGEAEAQGTPAAEPASTAEQAEIGPRPRAMHESSLWSRAALDSWHSRWSCQQRHRSTATRSRATSSSTTTQTANGTTENPASRE